MLARRTLNAIALLFERSDIHDRPCGISAIGQPERLRLQDRLTEAGLLNASGELNKPLESISLFELLNILGETLYIYKGEEGSSCDSGISSRVSLQMLDRSFNLWLKSIKLNEL